MLEAGARTGFTAVVGLFIYIVLQAVFKLLSLVDIPREHESPSETPCTVHDIHEETEKNEDVVESISEPRRSHGDPRVN